MRTTGNGEKILIKNALKWQGIARLAWLEWAERKRGQEVKEGAEEGGRGF